MADKAITVGIDLGGTNIKGGICDSNGRLLHNNSIATQADRGPEHVLNRIVHLVHTLLVAASLRKDDVLAVGVGSPGPLSPSQGIVYQAANLPGWEDVAVRDYLRRSLDLPTTLDNDANAAAYGEFIAGAGRGARNVALLTLGTGIGGGIIVDGAMLHGAFENAGEIGHMIVQANGRPCRCGQRGCLEQYASASAVADRYTEAARDPSPAPSLARQREITSLDVAEAARQGDPLAVSIWDDTCRYLAIGCVNLQHILNPERIILGGGMMDAGAQVLEPTRQHFRRLTWKLADDAPSIEPAVLGNRAGIIGAAALARLEHAEAA